MTEVSFSELFARALHGVPCEVVPLSDADERGGLLDLDVDLDPGAAEQLPLEDWRRRAVESDLDVLDLCRGATIDVGCGPGRMAEALAERGHDVLGIDVVDEAARLTRQRGVAATRHDVFDALPHDGCWTTVLLADGNVGIGGDPVRLLRRVGMLLEPGGRVVVDLAAPGTDTVSVWALLRCGDDVSRPFRWSTVGVEAIEQLALDAGLRLRTLQVSVDDRWTAVLDGPLDRPPGS